LAGPGGLQADEGAEDAPGGGAAVQAEPSGYAAYRGEPFFLLADTSYGSSEVAKVRLEAPNRSFASMADYGGADIVLYRINKPLEFLRQQKNLHRIRTDGNYSGEGLSNTLSFLWDDWYKKSRREWQTIFTKDVRTDVTREAPQLLSPKGLNRRTQFSNPPQYAPLQEKKGFHLVDRFRYPLVHAKSIPNPEGVRLEGSSSNFGMSTEGNVYIPLGKLKPGLYLVEAIVGKHRANTVVFVSNTVAITKTSSNQMMVWATKRDSGLPVGDVGLVWTDGVGVLASGKTDARGIATLEKAGPEKSYLIGQDAEGGVLISENFYYDSEIYNTKIYAMTDRPLYRPGDEVNIRFLGRHFLSARESEPMAPGSINLEVLDPNGMPVAAQKLAVSGQGAQTMLRLPREAVAGGYELRYTYQDNVYTAAFRVADYVKPHFEISVLPDRENYKTNQTISGRMMLTYPDGKPVKSASVQLTVRAQATTMVEGEMRYSGMFPVKLETMSLTSDDSGMVKFSLPAAKDPSRYVLTIFASDGAAYRVKATKELLIERSAGEYTVHAAQQFTQPGAQVQFDFERVASSAAPAVPVRYEIVRLETRSRSSGKIAAGARNFSVNFADSGSYSVLLYDDNGNMVGACSHWVAGPGLKTVKGSIEIVLDRGNYKPGDTAEALITFPEPVDSALVTLERDRVEQGALLQGGGDWVKATRVAPTQWRAQIVVASSFAPNITLSVAYVKHGEWVFQNRGILVEQPHVDVQFKTAKEVYLPGEIVKVEVETRVDGRPGAANVSVGVVDEMIYVLQPEIVPNISDFFYHPRRNNVRTQSSLQFIGYDMAGTGRGGPPSRGSSHERALKVLERPRRENVDTAYWNGQLSTDENGRASFTFVMPDSLTRWRITGRAMSTQGLVGQRTAYLRSDKPFYAKWISPGWMRKGDAPVAALAVFNQTGKDQAVVVNLNGGGIKKSEKLTAKRGINTLSVPLAGFSGDTLHVEVNVGDQRVDALDVPMKLQAQEWKSPHTQVVAVKGNRVALALPKDASNVRVSFANGAAQQFSRIMTDLVEYPYGCVEQTASRMLPLAFAVQSMPQDAGGERAKVTRNLRQLLQDQRMRLVYMAGPNATFGWWGNGTHNNLLLTAYAYYADYTASRVLGLNLPPENWDNLLTLFGQQGEAPSDRGNRRSRKRAAPQQEEAQMESVPLSQRALALWLATDMQLPTRTLVSGLLDDLEKEARFQDAAKISGAMRSPAFADPEGSLARAMTLQLAALMAAQHHLALPPGVSASLPAALAVLEQSSLPSAQALLLLGSKKPDREQAAERILNSVRAEMPTFDRSLALIWLNKLLAGKPGESVEAVMEKPWKRTNGVTGAPIWRPSGNAVPSALVLAKAPDKPITAFVQYESSGEEKSQLPVTVQRKLFHLTAKEHGGKEAGEALSFEMTEMADKDEIMSNELYLEEIELTPGEGTNVRFGLIEAPLPPGAEVEASTWGVVLPDGNMLERAQNEPSQGGYAVPVERLDRPLVVRHLLRFSQKGQYRLPPARFYSMYAPESKAFEAMEKSRVLVVK
jgi:uncharacterized protein YfaS (alpha-2-macroglobulin family)